MLLTGEVLFPSDDLNIEYSVYDLGYRKFDDVEEIVEEIEETGIWTKYASLENAVDSPIIDAWEVGDLGLEGLENGFILFFKDEENPDSQFIYCDDNLAESPFHCFANHLAEEMTEVSPESAKYAVVTYDDSLYGYFSGLLSDFDLDADIGSDRTSRIASMILDYAEQESKVLYLA